jgi:hypothetical protein
MYARIINWVLKEILKAVTIDKVFTNISSQDRADYSVKAQTYLGDKLFMDLLKDMERQATEMIAVKSTNTNEMLFGKAMLYTIDVQRKKLKELASYNKPEVKQNKW